MSPQDIEILIWCPGGVSLTSWRKGASLALVGHPSSNAITIKVPHGVDVLLHQHQSHTPSFPIGLIKFLSDFLLY